ncbi:MAG: hypothetical protein ACI8W8_003981 [Rhodothermales bacterium]|jgi:hypothetical protein
MIRLVTISALCLATMGCANSRGYLADRAADLTDVAHLNLSAFSRGHAMANVGPAVVGYQRLVGIDSNGYCMKVGLGGIEELQTSINSGGDRPTFGLIIPLTHQAFDTRSLVGYGKRHPPWGSVGADLGLFMGIGMRADLVELADFTLGWIRLDLLRDDKNYPAPFSPVGDDLGFGYARAGSHIYFGGGQDWPEMLRQRIDKSVDADSFKALSLHYTKDKRMVYYNSSHSRQFRVVELPAADPATFEVVGSQLARDKHGDWWYGRRRGEVPVDNADQSRKDAQNVWVYEHLVVGANVLTFRHLGGDYYRDATHVYWRHHLAPEADPETLRTLGSSFLAVDAKSVYRAGKRLAHLDRATCKLIQHSRGNNSQVFSDKNGVYLNHFSFLHANPDDFTMLDYSMAKGKNHVFLIDTYHTTPITAYREDGRLIAETYLYDMKTKKPQGVVTAAIEGSELSDVSISPLPGAAEPIPDTKWQVNRFGSPGTIERMKAAAKLLE